MTFTCLVLYFCNNYNNMYLLICMYVNLKGINKLLHDHDMVWYESTAFRFQHVAVSIINRDDLCKHSVQ